MNKIDRRKLIETALGKREATFEIGKAKSCKCIFWGNLYG